MERYAPPEQNCWLWNGRIKTETDWSWLGNGLELALCNPNLRPEMLRKNYWESRPTPMAIELKGKWKLKPDKKVSGLTIGQNERGNTILKAKLAEGNPIYVSLIKL